ncbi:MAG: FHA domain-containing protein [Myxococcota bacterium]
MRLECEVEDGVARVDLGPGRSRVLVGRHPSCDLHVTDPTVSRRHCEFLWSDGAVEVHDLGSTAGTFVNGHRIDRAAVTDSDRVTCGNLDVRLAGDVHDASAPQPAAAAAGEWSLVYVDRDGFEMRLALDPTEPPVVVGRHPKVDLQVHHPTVSRRHAELGWVDGRLEVRDLGSSAGTAVNGQRIERAILQPGDEVHMGEKAFRVVEELPEAEPVPGDTVETWDEDEAVGGEEGWTLVYDDPGGGGEMRCSIDPDAPPIILGRNPDVDVRLQDPSMGRKHCRVGFQRGQLIIEDLNSRNGTFVNDDQVTRRVLHAGDQVVLGSFPLRVDGPEPALEEWGDWDDDWDEELPEMGPPTWHVVFTDDDGYVSHETLGPSFRLLAVGSDEDCEICAADRGAEPDHAELMWDEGVLVVADLKTEVGTRVHGGLVDEYVLRNGDVVTCGDLRLRAVRGGDSERAGRGHSGIRSGDANLWATHLRNRDSAMGVLFTQQREGDEGTCREEVTVFGDGEARLELQDADLKTSYEGRVRLPLVEALLDALLRAGFPDAPKKAVGPDETPVEIAAFQDNDRASLRLGRRGLNRSEDYREAVELFRALIGELREG